MQCDDKIYTMQVQKTLPPLFFTLRNSISLVMKRNTSYVDERMVFVYCSSLLPMIYVCGKDALQNGHNVVSLTATSYIW